MCMSPALNRSSALQCFEPGNAVEIRNEIMYYFYMGLPLNASVTYPKPTQTYVWLNHKHFSLPGEMLYWVVSLSELRTDLGVTQVIIMLVHWPLWPLLLGDTHHSYDNGHYHCCHDNSSHSSSNSSNHDVPSVSYRWGNCTVSYKTQRLDWERESGNKTEKLWDGLRLSWD